MYQHCASCIPLSHAHRTNVLQQRQIIAIYQPNASIEITAHDRKLFHCTIRIPSRWKVTTENFEPPGHKGMQTANPIWICMERHMRNLWSKIGWCANSNALMIGTTAEIDVWWNFHPSPQAMFHKWAQWKSHWSNSAIKSSQRDSHRTLCKFLTMTCTHCSMWSASFAATGDGLSLPFPVAVFLLSTRPPLYIPYSMSEMKSFIASCTIAGTLLASFHSIVKSSFTKAMGINFPLSRTMTLNNL